MSETTEMIEKMLHKREVISQVKALMEQKLFDEASNVMAQLYSTEDENKMHYDYFSLLLSLFETSILTQGDIKTYCEEEEKKLGLKIKEEKKLDLKINQLRRQEAILKHNDFLDEMIGKKENGKSKKKIRYRRWLRGRIKQGADTLFSTYEEEYQFVNKFGRGMWNEVYDTFGKMEMQKVVALASDYGAFDN